MNRTQTGAWQVIRAIVYATSGLALALAAILGIGGYVFYMVVWMHAPLGKVLFVTVPCALVLLVGAQASASAARNTVGRGKTHGDKCRDVK